MRVLVVLAAAAIVVVAVHRLALWMESRGWIYYSRRKPSSSTLGNAFLEVQSMLQPGTRHLLEVRREEPEEESESGDPPEPGQRQDDRQGDLG